MKNLKGKNIFIIHNLQFFTEILQVENYIENTLLRCFNLEKNHFLIENNKLNSIYFKQINKNIKNEKEYQKNNLIHLIYARENSEAGEYYNNSVKEFIKSNINAYSNPNRFDALDLFRREICEDLKTNPDNLELLNEEVENKNELKTNIAENSEIQTKDYKENVLDSDHKTTKKVQYLRLKETNLLNKNGEKNITENNYNLLFKNLFSEFINFSPDYELSIVKLKGKETDKAIENLYLLLKLDLTEIDNEEFKQSVVIEKIKKQTRDFNYYTISINGEKKNKKESMVRELYCNRRFGMFDLKIHIHASEVHFKSFSHVKDLFNNNNGVISIYFELLDEE